MKNLSPAIQDLVARVGQVGLHKIAAQMRGKESLELHDIVQELGTKLAYQSLKQVKIAAGMASLKNLEANGSVKLSNMFQLGEHGVKSLLPKASRAAEELKGSLRSTHEGIVSKHFPAAKVTEAPSIHSTWPQKS